MTDLEKVINAIQICYTLGHNCTEYPFFSEDDCNDKLMQVVLALLKAQEPMVMDADEIVQSADPSKWLWVERKGDYCAEAFKAGKTISGLIAFDSETPGAFLYCERPDDYGKTWRCWTSRPTDEQRAATPWEPLKGETK